MRKREILSAEERQYRKELRNSLIEERKRVEEAESARMLAEAEAKKKKYTVDYNLFTQICKSGFIVDNTPNGRVDISFTRVDIQDLCKELVVEKEYYGQFYKFQMVGVGRIDKIEILKRSPLFQAVAETI